VRDGERIALPEVEPLAVEDGESLSMVDAGLKNE
jgi:hypothetical protein